VSWPNTSAPIHLEPLYLNKWQINYTTGRFEPVAVYPNITTSLGGYPFSAGGGGYPQIVHANGGRKYLVFQGGMSVYKFSNGPGGTELLTPSSGIVANWTDIPRDRYHPPRTIRTYYQYVRQVFGSRWW
jgi:hypothetical protein